MTLGVFHVRLELLPKESVQAIKETAFEILETIGFSYKHPRALELLENIGANVNFKEEVAKIPRELVLEVLRKVNKAYTIEPLDSENRISIGDGKLKVTMCSEVYLVDYIKKERRLGLSEDCLKSITLGNALENISVVTPFIIPSDVPIWATDVRGYKLLFTYSRKPCSGWIYSPESARCIIEMAKRIVGGGEELRRRKIVGYGAEPTSPLQLSRHAIEIIIEMAKYDLPISATGSMIMLGTTGPMSIAGSLSLLVAEVLAGIVLTYLLSPKSPVSFSTSIHVFDQRTLLCSFGAPENVLASLAGVQIAKSFGLPCFCNVGLSDSLMPDFQCGFEKALGVALVIAAGAEWIGSQGIVGADQGASWEQLVIDNEWINVINRILGSFDVTEETLALDVIRKVGIGGTFLGQKHTLKYMKSEVWYPDLFERKAWEQWIELGGKDVLQRAHERVEEILKESYPQEPVIDRALVRELETLERDYLKERMRTNKLRA